MQNVLEPCSSFKNSKANLGSQALFEKAYRTKNLSKAKDTCQPFRIFAHIFTAGYSPDIVGSTSELANSRELSH
jgi:hypothetical protein